MKLDYSFSTSSPGRRRRSRSSPSEQSEQASALEQWRVDRLFNLLSSLLFKGRQYRKCWSNNTWREIWTIIQSMYSQNLHKAWPWFVHLIRQGPVQSRGSRSSFTFGAICPPSWSLASTHLLPLQPSQASTSQPAPFFRFHCRFSTVACWTWPIWSKAASERSARRTAAFSPSNKCKHWRLYTVPTTKSRTLCKM